MYNQEDKNTFELIESLYIKEQKSIKQISTQFGKSKSWIYKVLLERGVEFRKKKSISLNKKKTIQSMYRRGYTFTQIVNEYDGLVSPSTISRLNPLFK